MKKCLVDIKTYVDA